MEEEKDAERESVESDIAAEAAHSEAAPRNVSVATPILRVQAVCRHLHPRQQRSLTTSPKDAELVATPGIAGRHGGLQ